MRDESETVDNKPPSPFLSWEDDSEIIGDFRRRFGGHRGYLTEVINENSNRLETCDPADCSKLKELICLKKKTDATFQSYAEAFSLAVAENDAEELSKMRQKEDMARLSTRFMEFMEATVEAGSLFGSTSSGKRFKGHRSALYLKEA